LNRSFRCPDLRRRRRPRSRRALGAVVVVLAVVVAGCSSSASDRTSASDGNKKPTTTVALDKNCLFHPSDAQPLVGSGAVAADPPKIAGIQTPIARCAYKAGDRMAQLTVFESPQMANSLATSLLRANAKMLPDLGAGGACSAGKGTDVATASCVWINNAKSYVMGLTMPVASLEKSTLAKVQKAAEAVDGRLPADTSASTTTTTKP
jgi:hypothetical protein